MMILDGTNAMKAALDDAIPQAIKKRKSPI
jgi:hypothetical protein